jgi:hypothetical protein
MNAGWGRSVREYIFNHKIFPYIPIIVWWVLQCGALEPTMMDPEYDPNAENPYECFMCGTVIEARNNPDSCPNCGGEMRNRLIPVE